MSSFDESESSGSKELDNGKEKGESLWSGHLCQSAKNCSAILTSNDPIVFNVSDSVLESVKSILKEQNFKKNSSSLVNQLGYEGDIVYTEIKVNIKVNQYNFYKSCFVECPGANNLEIGR